MWLRVLCGFLPTWIHFALYFLLFLGRFKHMKGRAAAETAPYAEFKKKGWIPVPKRGEDTGPRKSKKRMIGFTPDRAIPAAA